MNTNGLKSLVVSFAAVLIAQNASAFCLPMTPGLCNSACQGKAEEITPELVQSADDDEKVCALSFAQDTNILALLIKQGVDVNTQTKHRYSGMPAGNTAYFEIESHNRVDLLEYLLQHGFNVNVQDHAGNSPLIYAAWDNKREMVEMLLKAGAQPNLKNRFGHTALCMAEGNLPFLRDEEIISMLKKSGGICDN